ncbi:hypothetical protein ACHIPZ_05285 [Antrihabitans sp. NCIMB 15449]|uniref:DUF222 domain-containing protein n=1 Tax=Antrihabitans spumae TaxID=3373370 RepID=A0ABW7JM19_9NOCA
MHSNRTVLPARLTDALATLEGAIALLSKIDVTGLTDRDRIAIRHRLNAGAMIIDTFQQDLIIRIQDNWVPGELGDDDLAGILAENLRITRTEASARIRAANDRRDRMMGS